MRKRFKSRYINSKLYKSNNTGDDLIEQYIGTINNPVLTEDDANLCEGEISIEELTLALTNMKLNKAPGADGLTT